MAHPMAFVLVKPRGITGLASLVEQALTSKGVNIKHKRRIKGEYDELVYQHQLSPWSNPNELYLPEDKFKEQFGLEWNDALESGKVFNFMDGCKELDIDADEMNWQWTNAIFRKKAVKFGRVYMALIDIEGKQPIFIFKNFLMSTSATCKQPARQEILVYCVEWYVALSWKDLQKKILSPYKPEEMPLMCEWANDWKELQFDGGNNSVQLPFEAFAAHIPFTQLKMWPRKAPKCSLLLYASCCEPFKQVKADKRPRWRAGVLKKVVKLG